MNRALTSLPQCRTDLGEGPVWCPQSKCLWWIDVTQPSLWRWDAQAASAQQWPLSKPPGTFALLHGGGLLLVFRNGMALMDERTPGVVAPLDLPGLVLGEERFNDGKVDRAGRLWVGSMDRKLARPLGQLRRADERLQMTVADTGFVLSNGIAWSHDNQFLYFAETQSSRIYRYRFDARNGSVRDRSILVQAEAGAGGPDGLTVDAEGFLWCAMFDRGVVNRYSPSGALDRRIALPVTRPTSCAFGGNDLKTLYITTARHGLSPQQLEEQPLAGSVLALTTDVPGLAEPRCVLDRAALKTLTPHQEAA